MTEPFRPRINRYGGRGHAVGGQDAKVSGPRRPSIEDADKPPPCKILVQNFQPVTPEGRKRKQDYDARPTDQPSGRV